MKGLQKLAVGMFAAVTITLATGIIIIAESEKAMRKHLKKRAANT